MGCQPPPRHGWPSIPALQTATRRWGGRTPQRTPRLLHDEARGRRRPRLLRRARKASAPVLRLCRPPGAPGGESVAVGRAGGSRSVHLRCLDKRKRGKKSDRKASSKRIRQSVSCRPLPPRRPRKRAPEKETRSFHPRSRRSVAGREPARRFRRRQSTPASPSRVGKEATTLGQKRPACLEEHPPCEEERRGEEGERVRIGWKQGFGGERGKKGGGRLEGGARQGSPERDLSIDSERENGNYVEKEGKFAGTSQAPYGRTVAAHARHRRSGRSAATRRGFLNKTQGCVARNTLLEKG
ncbi:hypothetical protein TGFOU_403650 [Toxoplasma gondii FOU]|uniref:Uncharacterized protein n=1 Tax=Toxoplasma gondii FOU TaxID=943167 RepID=A0A086LAT0_TOXGO|nr:hypothetical protein TGFOU_403650 [Toxoplasma gondii FOU]